MFLFSYSMCCWLLLGFSQVVLTQHISYYTVQVESVAARLGPILQIEEGLVTHGGSERGEERGDQAEGRGKRGGQEIHVLWGDDQEDPEDDTTERRRATSTF